MPRPKVALLRPEDVTWLESLQKRYRKQGKRSAMSGSDRVRFFRIKKRIMQIFHELAYLTEILPEKQQSQIFTRNYLFVLARNLLGTERKQKAERHYHLARMFAELSLPICQEKLDKRSGLFLRDKFAEMDALIRVIIPDENILIIENTEKQQNASNDTGKH